jgi:hypothetical protein
VASACGQLDDFAAEVRRKLRDGALTSEDADTLLAAAAAVQGAIGC